MDRRHDQHVGGPGQARERIEQLVVRVQRHVGIHVAFVFEVDALCLVEDRDRIAHLVRTLAHRVAKSRVGQERNPRREAEAAHAAYGLKRDVGQRSSIRQFVDARIGDEDGLAHVDHHRHADHGLSGDRVEHQQRILQRRVISAGHARHHAVRIAVLQHAAAEHVAILVHQALHVALQIPFALQPLVQHVDIGRVVVRQARIDDVERAGRHAHLLHRGFDLSFAADQDRMAKPLVLETPGCAHHRGFFAFCKNDPALHVAALRLHALQEACGWVCPAHKALAVGFHVRDRLAGNTGIHGGLRDQRRHEADQARVERRGDDVFPSEGRAGAVIGGGHFVRHVFAREFGQRACGSDLHFLVDAPGTDIQRAAEDVGKAQNIVDLVGIVRPSGRNDRIAAHGLDVFGSDLRIRVGHREDDRVLGHGFHHVLGHRALDRQAEEDIRAVHRFGEGPLLGLDREGGLELVHLFRAAFIDHAGGVAEQDILALHAEMADEAGDRQARRARAGDGNLDVGQLAPGDVAGVDQAGGGDDRGSVLVVMEHRNVEFFAQAALDDEAIGRRDVLKVDAAPGRADIAHCTDEVFCIRRVHFDIKTVDIREPFEQDRLALHHRLRGHRTEIAETENGRAVGDHRHEVSLGRIIIRQVFVSGDRKNRDGHAGAVGQRQVALRAHRLGRDHRDLARGGVRVEIEGFLVGEARTLRGHVGSVSFRLGWFLV